jgi:SAM-dependent methyltransferase
MFFGELYLRSTRPFLTEQVTEAERACLARLFEGVEGPICDLGCGHGRHLQSVGAFTVGVDFDQGSLCEAAAHAPVVRGDLFRLPFRDGAFGGAYAWYNTLFVFDDHRQRPLFAELHRVLKPGGLLVMQTYPREKMNQSGDATFDGPLPGGGGHLYEKMSFNRVTGRDEGHRRLTLEDGRVMGADFFIRYYETAELLQMLESENFTIDFVHGGLEGQPLTDESNDLIVGARRA